jgi:hypothetical protein
MYVTMGVAPTLLYSQQKLLHLHYNFLDDTIDIATDSSVIVSYTNALSIESIEDFYTAANASNYQPLIDTLLAYKEKNKLSDWLYYQLIRKTAQQIAPKAENYPRYTLYKWFFLAKSGYDATLGISKSEILFYTYSTENIYDLPLYTKNDRQYVCLNYHDYGKIDFTKDTIKEVPINIPEAHNAFSYKINEMPDFKPSDYVEKDLQFSFRSKVYQLKIMMNPQVKTIFANYPVVDFESYFNIPLTKETYSSLIPKLKENVKKLSRKEGVDYLMQFTRSAFLYESDQDNFGKEKRLSPEQTLLYQYSDCDDRVALFYYLVKEIYNLPMIAIMYPTHITMAVKFHKPIGKSVIYNGEKYSICDPTAQTDELKMGEIPDVYRKSSYQIVYEYNPQKK